MAVPLTPDLCARALLAACAVYGKDPFVVVAAARHGRTPLVAAASAARKVTGASVAVISRVFQVHQTTVNKQERIGDAKFRRATLAAWEAIVVDEAGPDIAPDQPVVDNRNPAPAGTLVAPPPVGHTPPARVDHTAAIAEAMARRRARGDIAIEVVGVEADKALIGATEPGACVWPMGDPRSPDYRSCQSPTLAGRMYCAEHLKAAGMKVAPKVIETVGRVAAPYVDRAAS